jgi:sugar O-acyltransferase (sialic acid O-acetyltransferase NeuD family)
VIGAGGHAKVVIATLEAAGRVVFAAVDDACLPGSSVLGVPVIGPLERAIEFRGRDAVVAIGNNETRRSIASRLPMRWISVVHPRAVVHSSVCIGPGTVVLAGAVIQPEAKVGSHAILNTASSVDHDCLVGDFAHIGPGTHLGGNVFIGRGAFLGIGANVLPNLTVGEFAVVGGGAVVVRDVPGAQVVAGIPARLLHRQGTARAITTR